MKKKSIGLLSMRPKSSWVILLIFCQLFVHSYSHSQSGKRYNVIMICVHDMNDHINFLDEPEAYAPNFQRLASHGMVFKRNYCQYPLCSPSRTSLLSGWRPDKTQVFGNFKDPRSVMGPDVMFIPEYFHLFGYRTERYGVVMHLQWDSAIAWDSGIIIPDNGGSVNKRLPLSQYGEGGIDLAGEEDSVLYKSGEWWIGDDSKENQSALVTSSFVARLKQQKAEPYFFAMGLTVTHEPFDPTLEFWNLNGDSSVQEYLPDKKGDTTHFLGNGSGNITLPNTPPNDRSDVPWVAFPDTPVIKTDDNWRKTIHAYDGEVSELDNYLGQVLNEIDKQNLWKNTVVIFWVDHGQHLGEHDGMWWKQSLFEESLHIPLIICVPGKIPGFCNNITENVDLYATLTELCGLPIPDGLEGQSLVPLLDNPDFQWKRAAFSQVSRFYYKQGLMGRSIRTQQYRYNSWENYGEELYDHFTDPNEYTNLAGNPQYQTVLDSMRTILAAGWTASQAPHYPLLTFYRDYDGDGYGNASDSLLAYAAPGGYIVIKGDCNDSNADVHPGATDVCDGIDNNCDGQVDENKPQASIVAKGSLDICSTGSVLLRANAGVRLRYQWRKDGTKISGATARTYTANLPGRYRVVVRDSTNCSNLSNILTVINSCGATSVDALAAGKNLAEAGNMVAYPIPSQGQITIRYNSNRYENLQLKVTDITGKTVMTTRCFVNKGGNTISLNISGLDNGVYFIEGGSGDQIDRIKIIVRN